MTDLEYSIRVFGSYELSSVGPCSRQGRFFCEINQLDDSEDSLVYSGQIPFKPGKISSRVLWIGLVDLLNGLFPGNTPRTFTLYNFLKPNEKGRYARFGIPDITWVATVLTNQRPTDSFYPVFSMEDL